MLRVKHHDPDLQRKGRGLGFILVVMAVGVIALAIFNLAHGYMQYNDSNAIFFLILVGLFWLNRRGYVTAASMLTVALTTAGSLLLVAEDGALDTVRVAMCVPILIASFLIVPWSGILIAALLIAGSVIGGSAPNDYPALLAIAVVALIAYMFSGSLNRAYHMSRHWALHDPLTRLPNRTLFVDRLQKSIDRKARDKGISAVLFMDLDNFKYVNDSLGHEVGDEVLVAVGKRLQSCLRPGDTAGRLGGDEFTILLDSISGSADAISFAERVARELRMPFDLGEHQVFLTMSIGMALNTSAGDEPKILLRDADVAMYAAKKAGKARSNVLDNVTSSCL